MTFRASILRIGAGFAAGAIVMGVWGARTSLPACRGECNPSGCAAPPCCSGDVNGDAMIDIADAVCLLSYLFGNAKACAVAELAAPSCDPCPPPAACPPGTLPLDGAYVWLPGLPEDNAAPFLDELAGLNIRLVLTQYAREPSADLPDSFVWSRGCPGIIGTVLDAAQARGIAVYVGLTYGGFGFYLEPRASAIIADIDATAAELAGRYGSNPAFAGWYVTDEPELAAARDPSVYFAYYARAMRAIRAHSGKPVVVSPYLKGAGTKTPEEIGRRSRDFLAATGVSILNWQDSVGAGDINIGWPGRGTAPTSGDYFRAIAAAVGRDRAWADIELFTTSLRGYTGGGYQPTCMSRLGRQMALAGDNVGRRTTWINQRHMSAAAADAFAGADRLLAAYTAWCGGEGRFVAPASYEWMTAPDPRYADRGNEPFNRASGDPKSYLDAEWTGVCGDLVIEVDLGSPRTVDFVACELLHLEWMNIRYPAAMEVSFSADKSAWSAPRITELGFEGENGEYVLANRAPLGAEGRYLRLALRNAGWTFLSEIEIVAAPAR